MTSPEVQYPAHHPLYCMVAVTTNPAAWYLGTPGLPLIPLPCPIPYSGFIVGEVFFLPVTDDIMGEIHQHFGACQKLGKWVGLTGRGAAPKLLDKSLTLKLVAGAGFIS